MNTDTAAATLQRLRKVREAALDAAAIARWGDDVHEVEMFLEAQALAAFWNAWCAQRGDGHGWHILPEVNIHGADMSGLLVGGRYLQLARDVIEEPDALPLLRRYAMAMIEALTQQAHRSTSCSRYRCAELADFEEWRALQADRRRVIALSMGIGAGQG